MAERQVAIVTGAASGIGRATATRFASEGGAVACLDLHWIGAEATARQVAALARAQLDDADRLAEQARFDEAIHLLLFRSIDDIAESPTEMFADGDYGDIDLAKVTVGGFGYRWICLRREFSL